MKIVFCLPGKQYSGVFLKSWTDLISRCMAKGIETILSQRYSPNIYMARNFCLGGDIFRGKNQKPFQGFEYDYILWIDSDIICSFSGFETLMSRNLDFVCGLYKNTNIRDTTAVKEFSVQRLLSQEKPKFITSEEAEKETEPFPVSFCGLGFSLMKYGVLEKLKYPWFRPYWVSVGDIFDFTTEDISICWMLKEMGVTTYVDPKVVVMHEKMAVM